MEVKSKRLWIVTLANIAVVALLPLVGYLPFYILFPIGLALSVTGLRFTKGVTSRTARRVASVINGGVLALDLVFIILSVASYFDSTMRFLVPHGYEGDVYVVFGARDGESPSKTRWGRLRSFRIPQDGILRTRDAGYREGLTWRRYYYEQQDGSLEPIDSWNNYYYEPEDGSLRPMREVLSGTSHLPENPANDSDIGLYRFRSNIITDSKGCSVEFEHFYVGTKAHLLSKYRQIDLGRYVREHPVGCSK